MKNIALGVAFCLGLCVISFLPGCPVSVAVPSLVGLSESNAEAVLASASLTSGDIFEDYSDTVAAGLIFDQDPIAGALVMPNSVVDLYVSLGPDEGDGEGEGADEGEGGNTMPEGISIAAGTFIMGRPDSEVGAPSERPTHPVALDSYWIGTYEITNQQYVDVLNWANAGGLLSDSDGGAYTGGFVYAYGQKLIGTYTSIGIASSIDYVDGVFVVQSRPGAAGEDYSMADHPVVQVTWYGAVLYCNWLSEALGLEPSYNPITWERFSPVRNGYRLPTEAEWERAAGWDGTRHWRYSFISDEIDTNRANLYLPPSLTNPLGLSEYPQTSPIGWFDGTNVGLGNGVATLGSASFVGCYDMSGNVWEWCHDWYGENYYANSPVNNPEGPATGQYRVLRGGAWNSGSDMCRSAYRGGSTPPDSYSYSYGFRIARSQ